MSYMFISSETNAGIAYALGRIQREFKNVTESLKASEYGSDINEIGIIMICATHDLLDEGFLKERKYVSWKKKYADMRLQIDYDWFDKADKATQRLLVAKNIIDSIRYIRDSAIKAKRNFEGDKLINEILSETGISLDQIDSL
jgi:hypothetical protein